MVDYKNPWSYDHERIYSVAGDPEVITYSPYYDDKGVLQLKESGKKNLYDEIQSHKLSTDIHYLLKRYANGEVDVLSKVQGVFGDFTNVPHSFAEMMNMTIEAKDHFDRLPIEIKQKFDNDFVQYMTAYGSEEWAGKLGLTDNFDASSEMVAIDKEREESVSES